MALSFTQTGACGIRWPLDHAYLSERKGHGPCATGWATSPNLSSEHPALEKNPNEPKRIQDDVHTPLPSQGVYTPYEVSWKPGKPRGMNKGYVLPS